MKMTEIQVQGKHKVFPSFSPLRDSYSPFREKKKIKKHLWDQGRCEDQCEDKGIEL